MSDVGLSIIIGADVSKAVNGLLSFESELQAARQELTRLDSAITNALARGADTTKLEVAFDNVASKIRVMNEAAAQAGSSSGLGAIAGQLQAIKSPAEDVSTSVQKMGLNTSQSRIAFIDLGRVVTGQGFSLRALASNFSLLGPGITIAAAAIYGLVEAFSKETAEEKQAAAQKKILTDQQNALYDAFKNTNEAQSRAIQQASDESARVTLLVGALQQGSLSRQNTVKAIQELKNIAPDYFSNLDAEHLKVEQVTQDYDKYNQSLITQIEIQQKLSELSNQVQKRLTFENDFKNIASEFDKLVASGKTFQQIIDETNKTINEGLQGNARSAAAGGFASAPSTSYLDASGLNQLAQFKQAEQDILDSIGKINAKTLGFGGDSGQLKSILPILEQIRKISEDIQKPNTQPLFKQFKDAESALDVNTPGSLGSIFESKISEAIQKAATDPNNAAAYKALAAMLQAQLDHIGNGGLPQQSHVDFTLANPADAEREINKYQSEIEKAASKMNLDVKIPAHFDLELQQQGFSSEEAREIIKGLEANPALKNFYFKVTPHLQLAIDKDLIKKSDQEKLVTTINQDFEKAISTGFENLGQSIGEAIAKGQNPIDAAGKSIISSLGTLIEDIGKSLIEYGIVKEGWDTIFSGGWAIPGVEAIAIGVGAEAIGALLKSSGSSYHAFATGGIVTGPTLGLVGEAGPEAIVPLDRLNNMIRANGQQSIAITGEMRLRGADISIAVKRADRLQSLTS